MRFMRGLLIATFGLCLWAVPPALAQINYTNPAYFTVHGVSPDDVLNIRAEPTASAPIVGTLAYNAVPVEIVREQAGWAYVSSGEGMGWVSMAYLRPVSVPMLGESALPEGLICSGTEPFWGMTINASGISFAGMDMVEAVFELSVVDGFGGVGPLRSFVIGEGSGQSMTAVISNEMCSDGMSDRDYPRRVDLVLHRPGNHAGYSGCCAIPAH